MQTLGHLVVNGQVVKVLLRPNLAGRYVTLKIRTTGRAGPYLPDESAHLAAHPAQLRALLRGQTIKV